MLQGDLDMLMNRAEFIIFMQSCVPLGPGKFHVVVLVLLKALIWYFYLFLLQGSDLTGEEEVVPFPEP